MTRFARRPAALRPTVSLWLDPDGTTIPGITLNKPGRSGVHLTHAETCDLIDSLEDLLPALEDLEAATHSKG